MSAAERRAAGLAAAEGRFNAVEHERASKAQWTARGARLQAKGCKAVDLKDKSAKQLKTLFVERYGEEMHDDDEG